MAITNHERVGKALEQLNAGLQPFVERELKSTYKDKWVDTARPSFPNWQQTGRPASLNWDTQALLSVMWDLWNDCFKRILGPSERSLVSELRDARNRWAHQKAFSTDDAYRAIDSVSRLMAAVNAGIEAVEQMKAEILRVKFEEQVRGQKRKEADVAVKGQPASGLKPWREIVTPHPDVASGRYQQAEFAADLWQVFLNEGPDEYRDPIEFFRRTFITEGLQKLLANALVRLAGQGGDPVVELQTNFGGGKTHSMLALYHLFSGVPAGQLPGLEPVTQAAGVSQPPRVKRAVLVGNRISPADLHKKPDGTVVRTLWGDLAWQLGGKEGYEMVRRADEKAISPGDSLRLLFKKYAPCLILIDEWVAYARQLYNKSDLPAGDFDAHFTFAQTLSESAKLAGKTLLVVSIPASQNEIGGEGGQAALERLKNVVGRVQTSWRPASAEESFEIVRRRLFQPITDPELFTARDTLVRAFADEYRKNSQEFPAEASKGDYERRMRAAYPIHPELFDRLYNDWSTLDKFQRTRGVLRLMAKVIHTLWEREDRGLLILPSSVPVDSPDVLSELTWYLPPTWTPIIEKDIDGPHSLPLQIDRENPMLGRYSACRRVARTVYLGSAPTQDAANKGLEDRQIKLGCVQPGEVSGTFGDALRKLADQATYLYVDGSRYWYSTQPSVNRLADERAERYHPEDVVEHIRQRLQVEAKSRGDFAKVQPCPASFGEVVDEPEAKLVILGPDYPHSAKSADSPARQAAAEILDRGGAGRNCGNMLVFLATDKSRLADLDKGARSYLAWESIEAEKEALDLTPFQVKQVEQKLKAADLAVRSRIPETYCWLLAPGQQRPEQGQKFPGIEWREIRLQGQEGLAERASKKLINDELLIASMAGTRLRLEIDQIPLWRANHAGVKQLVDDFAKYLYLPRVKNAQVILDAIQDGISRITWRQDTFAYADSYDATSDRYRGLQAERRAVIELNPHSVVVRPEVAARQMDAGMPAPPPQPPPRGADETSPALAPPAPPPKPALRRFHGTAKIDATRLSRDADQIAGAVVQHLTSLLGAQVNVTLEIAADIPSGAPDHIVRTVTENCRTLKFENSGFEES
ncbi:MAG: ATP-binding protein [Acidobacteria bacterium]|nr:ATP-binding protein [Acidobacteriota bacterium]